MLHLPLFSWLEMILMWLRLHQQVFWGVYVKKIFLFVVTFFLRFRFTSRMDAKGYNACVHQWADALFRFACKCTGNEEDARDIVQSSFEALWQKRESVLPEKGKAFLFQVAYNQSVDMYRKSSRIAYKEELRHTGSIQPGSPDLKRVLDRALAQLDEQARALVLLKDYEGYKYEEVAQIVGLSETQVKVYLHRARKNLKQYLVSVEHII